MDNYSVRINASLLPKYVGKVVTIIGNVDAGQISEDGSSFKIKDGENKDVTIMLPSPLTDIIEGTLEVMGTVDRQCNVQCLKYHPLPVVGDKKFNMELYNDTLKFIHQQPEYFAYGDGLKRSSEE